MQKKIALAVVVAVLGAGYFCLRLSTGFQSSASRARQPIVSHRVSNRFAALNQKLYLGKLTDSQQVEDITNETLTVFAPPDIPTFAMSRMRDRIVRAELAYQRGEGKGIPENSVVKTINRLADQLSLPAYARVGSRLVRVARMSLMVKVPKLINQDRQAQRRGHPIGTSINPLMSPLEATAVTLFLMQQKTLNESYQVSDGEFLQNVHAKQLERWQESTRRRALGLPVAVDRQEGGAPSLQSGSSSHVRTEEIRKAMKAGLDKMPSDALVNLADSCLDDLGIQR